MRKSGNRIKNGRTRPKKFIEIDECEGWEEIEELEEDLPDDEEAEENFVSGETLEFISLDDEMIETYNRSVKQKKKEVYEEEEDWEEEEDIDEEDIDDEEDDEDFEDDEDCEDDEDFEDDEEDDEDDEEYEDEEEYEYYEEPHKRNIFVRIGDYIANMSTMDRVVTLFGCFIVMAAVATSSLYMNAKLSSKKVEAFAEVGADMAEIGVIGQSGLLAVSDAESARMYQIVEEEQETEEEEESKDSIEVSMKLSSIQADIKIKFVNKETNKLLGGLPFEVEVSGDNGKQFNLKDEDKDGIIYQTGVNAGTYTVKALPLEGEAYKDYQMPTQASTVKVTDTITYKEVDVADEVKTEAEVNVAVEDTAKQDTQVESTLTDTVEWVESTKNGQDSDDNYQEIQKTDIADPSLSGRAAGFVKMVGLSATSLNLKVDETAKIEITDAGEATVEWSSANSSIATVSNGEVKAVGEGTTTITATVVDGENLACTVTVTAKEPAEPEKPTYTQVTISGAGSIEIGGTCQLSASTEPTGGSVTWSSSDSSVASVDGNGLVTGKSAGTVTITASCNETSGVSGTCSVTVNTAQPKYTKVAVSGGGTIQVGKTCQLSASTEPTGGSVTWSSSNSSVASVDGNGLVTGKSAGTVTITASCNETSGVSGTCTVTVTPEPVKYTKVTVSGGGTIQVGKTCNVSGTTEPAGGTITWKSSDDKIATVDSKTGVVTGKAAGTVTITGTCNENTAIMGTCTVTVAAEVKYTDITISGSESILVGKTGTLTAKTTPEGGTVTWKSDNEKIAKIDDKGTLTGVAVGTATITATCKENTSLTKTWKVTVKKDASGDTQSKLKDKNGQQIYVKNAEGKYVEATYADYYKEQKFYLRKPDAAFSYTGWQTIDGYTYFFDKNGNKVTGEQIIQGAKYNFGSDGRLSSGSGHMGIDVSKWNGGIDWNAVKNSGVSYVIIRCGYRGSSTGALIEDPKFKSNIQGAKAAGLKVGVYFFSQAVNEVEAVEEASMALNLIKGYGLDYPVFLDVESSGGRGDAINVGTRTAVCKAFCATIQNSGYSAGVYANKTWFTSYINAGSLTAYKLWLAQYASAPTYTATRYDMWQYSSKGSVSGISGNVDMNISYMNY